MNADKNTKVYIPLALQLHGVPLLSVDDKGAFIVDGVPNQDAEAIKAALVHFATALAAGDQGIKMCPQCGASQE